MQINIHTDGGSRGNPGPAAIGVVIEQGSVRIAEFGKVIGITTNNVAEYTAVIEALKYVIGHQKVGEQIKFYLDSMLVVNQLNGVFKVKDTHLSHLVLEVKDLERKLQTDVTYTYVPREDNRLADLWVNRALDAGT